jgi:hypothetical protein
VYVDITDVTVNVPYFLIAVFVVDGYLVVINNVQRSFFITMMTVDLFMMLRC